MARRISRGLLYVVAIAGIFVLISIFIIWPTVNAYLIRKDLLLALRSAHAVRLEEFSHTNILNSVELPQPQWHEVAHAVAITLVFKGSETGCFNPHHRIVVKGEHEKDFSFTVCFECGKVSTEEFGILATPTPWRLSLRQLFLGHGIPVRDTQEYFELD